MGIGTRASEDQIVQRTPPVTKVEIRFAFSVLRLLSWRVKALGAVRHRVFVAMNDSVVGIVFEIPFVN